MKFFYLPITCILISYTLKSQDIQSISVGAGYNNQSYISLLQGKEKLVKNNSWDIMFTAFGFQDAGIFINESTSTSMGQPLPGVEVFDAKTTDFTATIDVESIKDNKLLNDEVSWSFGAFNEGRNVQSPFDFGWGTYQPNSNSVIGSKVYVIKLRNGEFRKLKIESLVGTTYTIKHAALDGSDEVIKTLNKQTDSFGKKFIFYNFNHNSPADILPNDGFDLMYARYSTLEKDPNGTIEQQYIVTGILSGPGVTVAEVNGVDPANVSYEDHKNDLSPLLTIIGNDWKSINATFQWSVVQDRTYFVKTADGLVWKIVFIDFEGSSTGTSVFEKTKLDGLSSTNDNLGIQYGFYPNPSQDLVNIVFEINHKITGDVLCQITDAQGKIVNTFPLPTSQGLQALEINTSYWSSGLYFAHLIVAGQKLNGQKIIKL